MTVHPSPGVTVETFTNVLSELDARNAAIIAGAGDPE